jgi:hypothetical protein
MELNAAFNARNLRECSVDGYRGATLTQLVVSNNPLSPRHDVLSQGARSCALRVVTRAAPRRPEEVSRSTDGRSGLPSSISAVPRFDYMGMISDSYK